MGEKGEKRTRKRKSFGRVERTAFGLSRKRSGQWNKEVFWAEEKGKPDGLNWQKRNKKRKGKKDLG